MPPEFPLPPLAALAGLLFRGAEMRKYFLPDWVDARFLFKTVPICPELRIRGRAIW